MGSSTADLNFPLLFPPTLISVTPSSGPTVGGTVVDLAGMNFRPGATVTFDGVPATGIIVVSSSHITATTPAHAAGAVSVTVTNPDSQTSTLVGGFTYTTLLVAVGTNIVATSPDGFVWTLGTIPASTYSSVAWNGSVFVAMGRPATSSDGVVWTQQAAIPGVGISTQSNALAWSPSIGLFVAPSGGGVLTSPDGITWTRQTVLSLNAAGAIAGLLVQVGGTVAQSSPDGITWTNRAFTGASGRAIAYDGSILVAAAGAGGAPTKRTADGITWNNGGATGVAGNTSIAWGPTPGVFVILGSDSGSPQSAFTSPDGTVWTAQALPAGIWKCVCWDGTKFVAVGLLGIVATSPDGVTWTPGTMAAGNWIAVAAQRTIFP
jgi:hypothetical protein